jgi:hypothetical protein
MSFYRGFWFGFGYIYIIHFCRALLMDFGDCDKETICHSSIHLESGRGVLLLVWMIPNDVNVFIQGTIYIVGRLDLNIGFRFYS